VAVERAWQIAPADTPPGDFGYADAAGVYFGARPGEVYASADEGQSWTQAERPAAGRAVRADGDRPMPTVLAPGLERRIRDDSGTLRRYVNVYVDGEDCRRAGGAGPAPRQP
jgi:hypothetical protein